MSNLIFSATDGVSSEELKKKFMDACREEKLEFCLVVRQMDNPALELDASGGFLRVAGQFWR